MESIWKFPLQVVDQQTIAMPVGAKLLTVQVQNDRPCLWALVAAEAVPVEDVDIRTHGTGHRFDAHVYEYIATYQLNNGALVFHVFRCER